MRWGTRDPRTVKITEKVALPTRASRVTEGTPPPNACFTPPQKLAILIAMSLNPATPDQTHSTAGALLEQKLVGEIEGRFFVARYQRGYRWGQDEVRRLLNDIYDNGSKDYSLQPVVVKVRQSDPATMPNHEVEWELVDGQQRLTTLYLIFLYMQREQLQNAAPPFSLTFETRPGSEAYLKLLDPAQSKKNIDFYHLYAAYECIRTWFESHGPRRQHVANKFYGFLFDYVRVIWYQAPKELDATTLFTRLNVGRIPLTDAELVKALLLSRSRSSSTGTDRSQELAANWDAIERDLRHPEIWAFVTNAPPEDFPTHITLLLDTVAGGPRGRARPRFHTFDQLRSHMEAGSPDAVWEQIVDLHALILGWFDNRDHYHKVGYLVAVGHHFSELVELAKNRTKSDFEALLDARIRETLNLSPSGVTALSYENPGHRQKCNWLLLLMNVETVRRIKDSTERYSFRAHGLVKDWSLEHIHAQQAESLNKAEQWKEWLRLHRAALAALPVANPTPRDELIVKIDASIEEIDREKFTAIAQEVTNLFTLSENEGGSVDSVHSISNLALLPCAENSALGNAVFEVKRRRILDLDRQGAYIPVCTRHVFLKYYTSAEAQQIHFWSQQDRTSYLEAMISPDKGVIFPYLQPAEPQP
jgi:hypothetical protein